jgi:hypothetical protein
MAQIETTRIRVEVLKDRATLFRECQLALGHDSPEQTFDKMLDLLEAAISLTSKDNPQVNLYTRDPLKILDLHETCPKCKHKFLPQALSEGTGFRELAVKMTP